MPKPLAICVEDLDAPSKASKYLQCVALPGRQPGLRLNEAGRAIWLSEKAVACELWVSADNRLVLYRPDDAPPVKVKRAGRSLDVPLNKPVILLDKDEVDVDTRHLRIHIHGEAAAVAAPTPLVIKPSPFDRLAQTAAAAAVIGTLATGCIEVRETPPVPLPPDTPTPTIEVRDFPPTATAPPVTPVVEGSVAWAMQGPWMVTQAYTVEGQWVQFNGTLTLTNGSYTFTALTAGVRPEAESALNFLLDNPWGAAILSYADGVTPESLLTDFEPGDVLATCTFYAGSTMGGEYQIAVDESGSLYFVLPSGASGDWQITHGLPD